MNRSLIRLMLACVLALCANAFAYAQGATSSLSGVVVRLRRRRRPWRHDRRQEQRHRHAVRGRQQHGRPLLGARARRRRLLGDRLARRLQDGGDQRSQGLDRAAAVRQDHARGGQPRGDDRRPQQQRHRQHADGDDLVDAQRRSDQQAADADAQRPQRRDVPARREYRRHQPRFELQRAARLLCRDHARRRQQQRQLQQVDRGPLRDGHAAAGRRSKPSR